MPEMGPAAHVADCRRAGEGATICHLACALSHVRLSRSGKLAWSLAAMKYVTQKARGIAALQTLRANLPSWIGVPVDFTVMPYQLPNHYQLPKFARPCPERPRHGFVESRRVRNAEELLNIWIEARTADPKAEVIIMDELSGKGSAIATDAGVTWGLGNDGVTAGGAHLWDIPCPNAGLTSRIKAYSAISSKDIQGGIFLEIVEHNDKPIIVQMRDGPTLAKATGNYVPHRDYRVTAILEPDDGHRSDLLRWEKRIAEAKPGSVVYLPYSGLSSHFAVHGIVHGLAVLTGTKHKDALPAIDSLLQPESDQPEPLRRRDYRAMRLMMRKKMPTYMNEAPGFATAVLHSMSGWGRERHLLALRIIGAQSMLRMLTAACVGEARHYVRWNRRPEGPVVPWEKLMGKPLAVLRKPEENVFGWGHCGVRECRQCNKKYGEQSTETKKFDRQSVFEACMEWPVDKLLSLADAARQDLSGKWGPNSAEANQTAFDEKGEIIPVELSKVRSEGCSYGGPRWRVSAEVAVRLGRALAAFQKTPNERTWKAVAARYNEGVACGHNNGRLLDKFCSWNTIDLCAKVPQFGFISRTAFEIVLAFKNARTTAALPSAKPVDETLIVGRKVAA